MDPQPHWKIEAWSLPNRLRWRMPMGPRQPNGEPEFGWRDMTGTPLPLIDRPKPIEHEAAARIEELEAALIRSSGLIDAMAEYIGKMALSAEHFAALNEHWMFMQRSPHLKAGD